MTSSSGVFCSPCGVVPCMHGVRSIEDESAVDATPGDAVEQRDVWGDDAWPGRPTLREASRVMSDHATNTRAHVARCLRARSTFAILVLEAAKAALTRCVSCRAISAAASALRTSLRTSSSATSTCSARAAACPCASVAATMRSCSVRISLTETRAATSHESTTFSAPPRGSTKEMAVSCAWISRRSTRPDAGDPVLSPVLDELDGDEGPTFVTSGEWLAHVIGSSREPEIDESGVVDPNCGCCASKVFVASAVAAEAVTNVLDGKLNVDPGELQREDMETVGDSQDDDVGETAWSSCLRGATMVCDVRLRVRSCPSCVAERGDSEGPAFRLLPGLDDLEESTVPVAEAIGDARATAALAARRVRRDVVCDAVVIELRASTHERSNERSSIDGRSLDPEEASASGVDGVAAMAGPPPTTEPVLGRLAVISAARARARLDDELSGSCSEKNPPGLQSTGQWTYKASSHLLAVQDPPASWSIKRRVWRGESALHTMGHRWFGAMALAGQQHFFRRVRGAWAPGRAFKPRPDVNRGNALWVGRLGGHWAVAHWRRSGGHLANRSGELEPRRLAGGDDALVRRSSCGLVCGERPVPTLLGRWRTHPLLPLAVAALDELVDKRVARGRQPRRRRALPA
eukprot:scaffold239540_cov33-Tisochrysis_lutea.AAC.3